MQRSVVLALIALSAVATALVVPRTEMEAGLWGSEGHSRARGQWRAVRRAAGATPIRLTFAIKQTNLDELERTLYAVSDPDSPTYAQHLTRDEVDAMVAPTDESLATVKHWLAQHNLQPNGGTGNEDFLFVDTTVAAAEQLLGDGAQYWEYEGVTTRAVYDRPTVTKTHRLLRLVSHYALPVNVAAHLDFVSPTIHFPRLKSTTIRKPDVQFDPAVDDPSDLFVTPPYLRELYQVVPNTTRGQNPSNIQSFASFLEQYWAPSDVTEFFKLFAPLNNGDSVAQSIGPNDPSQGTGTEAELDVQYIMGVGAGVTTWSYYTAGRAPNPDNEPFLDWLTLIASEQTIPAVFSVSYGEAEQSVGLDYGSRVNTEFQKVGVRGSSIMFAAGDDGAGGNCTAAGRFSPDFPSGSPWVTAVGGLVGGTAGATPTGEETDGISGGGFSDYWPQPTYQSAAVSYYLSHASGLPSTANFNTSGRGYPDVAAQSEMFIVVQDGVPLPGVGGTSCASPSFTGVISLLNDARASAGKKPLGFLNPLLYKIGATAADTNALNDVTVGANIGCDGFSAAFPAWKNWDAATGWGSPNYRLLKPIVLALP